MSARTESEIEREVFILKSAWESLYGRRFAITLAEVQMDDVVFEHLNFHCDGCAYSHGYSECSVDLPKWIIVDGKGGWRLPEPEWSCGRWTTTLARTLDILEAKIREGNSHV